MNIKWWDWLLEDIIESLPDLLSPDLSRFIKKNAGIGKP